MFLGEEVNVALPADGNLFQKLGDTRKKILLVLTIKQRKQNFRKIKANARNVVLLVALVIHYKFAETMAFETQHYYDFQVL